MEASVCSRKRPCGAGVLQLHQEAQCLRPACKRSCRDEDEMKRRRRRTGGCENREPGEHLQRNMRTMKRQHRQQFSQSGTRTRTRTTVRTGSGFRSEVQSCGPEVRVALIRKTRIQTSELIQDLNLTDQTDPGSTETQLDQRRPTWIRQTRIAESRSAESRTAESRTVESKTVESRMAESRSMESKSAKSRMAESRTAESSCELRSRSTSWSRSRSQVKHRSRSQVRTRSSETSRRSDRVWDPESCRGDRSRSAGRRRMKIHPSVLRGRGQLQLSITPEAGQLIVHIHAARGLMGKSPRSCDSYVKVVVTSDLDFSIVTMTTPTVLNSKNPEFNHSFVLCVTDGLVLSRLVISVFSRCSQLIGCMSFGIGSLISSSKLVTGWFYLLGEEFGRQKHLRVTSQQNKPMRSLEDIETHRADLRRTPDSAPDTDSLNRMAAATTANLSNSTTVATGLGDLSNRSLTSSCPQSFNLTTNNTNYSGYVSTLYTNANQRQATRNSGSIQQLTVNIARGKDGFGFTICSDCPVRVQAVDSGGPAHQSGLRQGDSVLQLNGVPVETWKCVDLAHAIRSCPSQIVLVVWRGLPELRSGCEALLRPPTHNTTTGRKLLPHPAHSKHGHRRRRGQRLGVRSSLGSLGSLGSLWRDRKEEQDEEDDEEDEEEQEVFSPRTATLKGTRVTSSHGDNYIILSPVSPGGQLLQPVYHDRNGTIGRLYQTHPSRGQNLLHDPRPSSSQRTFSSCTSTLPPPPSTSSSSSSSAPQPGNYGNYQNCTIVQSHLPCSSYGTYITLAPKTLIFPVFVQPLDLCSPDRTLLMAEEMILHQNDQLPAKVTVLIYSDLLLFTREDEAGRCNVLQSPVYLNALQLREAPSEPLLLHLLQMTPMSQMSQTSQTSRHRLFSLEAFSIEQKVRVSLCLHDNIQLQQQLVATDTERHAHHHQLSDLPSDFGLLSLRPSDLLFRPSSPFSSPDPAPLLLRPSSPFSSPLCDPSPSLYSPSSPFSSCPPPPPQPLSSLSPCTSSSSPLPPSRILAAPSQLLPLAPPSSSSTQRSPVWKERGGGGVEEEEEEEERKKRRREELVEERQQGEGESASETSESVGGVGGRGLLLSPHHFNMKEEEEEETDEDEEEEEEEGGGAEEFSSSYKRAVLRRSLSEGSLLQEPRSPRFLSDSTIHRLTCPATLDPDLDLDSALRRPSIQSLRKQLTREGGTLHQLLLLLNGTKDAEFRNLQLKKKNKSLAADVRSRLLFLRRRKNSACVHGNSLEKALRNNRPSAQEVLRWAESLEALLTNQYGLAVFRHFLRSEFSEENLDFWLAVERFKRTRPLSKMATRAAKIYDEFISTDAARQVNVDSSVRESTNQSLCLGVSPASFQLAQDQIFGLMESDSYPRFLRSRLYAQLANQGTKTAAVSAN